MLTRRQFLKFGAQFSAVAGAALILPQISVAENIGGGKPEHSLMNRPFMVPLPVPRILEPVDQDETTDYYEITIRAARKAIVAGTQTQIWGFEGEFPGPTIVARTGRQVVVRQTNGLDVPVTVHLHGGIVPPSSDGMPMDPILPGMTREYVYPNEQPAATLWYHDHAMDETGLHCYMGLCGFYLIRDDFEDALPLPKGQYDIPLAITDRTFYADGSFNYPAIEGDTLMHGAMGDTILVNGMRQPRLAVANRKYRFRFLNASNARPYELTLSTAAPMTQIGGDGGLLPGPVERETIRIDAAERAEVVIDFSAYPVGTRVVLNNLLGYGDLSKVMCFDVVREEADDSSVPSVLRPIERLDPADAVTERNFEFGFDAANGLWTINGLAYDHHRIDARPVHGTTEIWRISNGASHGDHTGMANPAYDHSHPFHLHGIYFQVLDRNGEQPPAWEMGWKDTVSVRSQEAVRILVRFDGHTGTYMFHCHKLEHEDRGMMGHFEVVTEDGDHGSHH
jgi:spore coat protein A